MDVQAFFDPRTSTLSYLVWDPASRDAVVFDAVLDYDPLTHRVWTESADAVLREIEAKNLRLHWIFDTHPHADHLSGARVLKDRLGAPYAIGRGVTRVQETFRHLLDLPGLATDGRQFDHLVADGEVLHAGTLRLQAIATPGHTPACMSYLVGDAVFVGDALFLPDYGVARCDFPDGDARLLYRSVHDKLYALPDDTRVFPCHDYQPGGRELRWETSIGASKRENVQLQADTDPETFVRGRRERDATLGPPKLLYQSLQVNVDGARLPEPATNGTRYFKVPLSVEF